MRIQSLEYANVSGRELTAEPQEPRVGVWRKATKTSMAHLRQHFGEREAREADFEFRASSAVRLSDGATFRFDTSETPWISPSTATVDAWLRRADDSLVILEDGRDRAVAGIFMYELPQAREISPDALRATDRDWLR